VKGGIVSSLIVFRGCVTKLTSISGPRSRKKMGEGWRENQHAPAEGRVLRASVLKVSCCKDFLTKRKVKQGKKSLMISKVHVVERGLKRLLSTGTRSGENVLVDRT